MSQRKNELKLPPLSPGHTVQMKNGFESSNFVTEKETEKIMNLRHNNTIKNLQRRQSKPRFIIKPLDQKEVLSISIADAENSASRSKRKGNLRSGRLASIN